MKQHHLRAILNEELHTRPFHDFEGTGRFIRYIYLLAQSDASIFSAVNRWLTSQGRAVITPDEKFRREAFDDYALRVERHSEFVTISFIAKEARRRTGLPAKAFDRAANSHLPFEMIEKIKHPVFHAIWLEIGGKAPKSMSPEAVISMLDSRTSASSLVSDGAGQAHFSFDCDDHGFSRAVLFNNSLSAERTGRLLLRMVELETYRMLALLGLPVVRAHSAALGQIETELEQLTSAISTMISENAQHLGSLLPQLSHLAAQAEKLSAETSFRLSASMAYQDVFYARMQRLNISRLDGHQGLAGFLDRRMMPALQTCKAFTRRLEGLSSRVERTGSLLRTHTEYTIQKQNTDLLSSMDRRARAQLRLQQTVEGLSVIAGTYYGVGLVGVVAQSLPEHMTGGLSVDIIKAASLPFVAVGIALILRRGSHMVSRLSSRD